MLAVCFVVLAVLFRELKRKDCVHIESAAPSLGGLFQKEHKINPNTTSNTT